MQIGCFLISTYFNVDGLKTRTFSYLTTDNHQNQEINSDTRRPSNSQGTFQFLQQSPSCPVKSGSSPGSHDAFRCHVSLFSFNVARLQRCAITLAHWEKKEALICSGCQFLWCQYFHSGQFQVTNLMSLSLKCRVRKRCRQLIF